MKFNWARMSLVPLFVFSQPSLAQSLDGSWEVHEILDSSVCDEEIYEFDYVINIRQDGNTLVVTLPDNEEDDDAVVMNLSGNVASLSHVENDEGVSVHTTIAWIFSGASFSGTGSQVYSGAGESCTETVTYNGALQSNGSHTAPPSATELAMEVEGSYVNASWTQVAGATGYMLYYAPFPAQAPIKSIDMKAQTSISVKLPVGTSMYVAIRPYSKHGLGPFSNIESFTIVGGSSGGGSSADLVSLTTNSSGTGEGSVKPGSGTYTRGQILTAWPSPHRYSYFHSWTNSSSHCAGGIGGCRIQASDEDIYLEARFEPITWSWSGSFPQYTAIYNREGKDACRWLVDWSDINIKFHYDKQGDGSYIGYLDFRGYQEAKSDDPTCTDSSGTLTAFVNFPAQGDALAQRIKVNNSTISAQYLNISIDSLNSGSPQGALAALTMEYTGEKRSGGGTLFPVFFSQTGAGRPRVNP